MCFYFSLKTRPPTRSRAPSGHRSTLGADSVASAFRLHPAAPASPLYSGGLRRRLRRRLRMQAPLAPSGQSVALRRRVRRLRRLRRRVRRLSISGGGGSAAAAAVFPASFYRKTRAPSGHSSALGADSVASVFRLHPAAPESPLYSGGLRRRLRRRLRIQAPLAPSGQSVALRRRVADPLSCPLCC